MKAAMLCSILVSIIAVNFASGQIIYGQPQQYTYKRVVAARGPSVGALSCPGGRIEYRQGGKFCCYDKQTTECYKMVSGFGGMMDENDEDRQAGLAGLIARARKLLSAAKPIARRAVPIVRALFAAAKRPIPPEILTLINNILKEELNEGFDEGFDEGLNEGFDEAFDEMDEFNDEDEFRQAQLLALIPRALRMLGGSKFLARLAIPAVRALFRLAGFSVPKVVEDTIRRILGDEPNDEFDELRAVTPKQRLLLAQSMAILVRKGKAGVTEVQALWKRANEPIPAALIERIKQLRQAKDEWYD